jgi:23S rRNA pseudouridine2457 synthase
LVKKPKDLFPTPFVQSDRAITSWLLITLTEGKYHQVRKMVTAVRHRCIRLIRVSIEGLLLGDIQPGSVLEIEEDYFFANINNAANK